MGFMMGMRPRFIYNMSQITCRTTVLAAAVCPHKGPKDVLAEVVAANMLKPSLLQNFERVSAANQIP